MTVVFSIMGGFLGYLLLGAYLDERKQRKALQSSYGALEGKYKQLWIAYKKQAVWSWESKREINTILREVGKK